MSLKFYEALKSILYEVETFLSVTLKDVKLPKTALNEKYSILQKIDNLQEEFPQLKVDLTQTESGKTLIPAVLKTSNSVRAKGPVPKVETEAGSDAGSDSQENKVSYEAEAVSEYSNVVAVTVKDAMSTCSHCGSLLRVSPGKFKQRLGALFGGKKFCVVAGGIFYIFDKPTSKKQIDSFSLQGYEIRSCGDQNIPKGGKDGFRFQIVCPGRKTYMFDAESQEDHDKWQSALKSEALKAPVICDNESVSSEYEDVANQSSENLEQDDVLYEDPPIETSEVVEEIYEEFDDVVGPPPEMPAPVTKPRPQMKTPIATAPANGENDCENAFYGLWDNQNVEKDELSFKRGDVLLILSREYDGFGWWIGELNGSVGLVPRDYLKPAYERVS